MKSFWTRMVSVVLIIAALFGYNQVISVRAEEDEAARIAAEEEYERLRIQQEANEGTEDDELYIQGGWAGSFAGQEGEPDTETEEEAIAEAETEAETEAGPYADGVYTGEGTGFGGIISVQVTVSGGFITDVMIISADNEDGAYLTMAEEIIQDIIDAQSADVDTVSGATFSSSGIRDAAALALEEAVK